MATLPHLTSEEADEFIAHLDLDDDGCITYSGLRQRLGAVLDDLQPETNHSRSHLDARDGVQRDLLLSIFGSESCRIPADEFKKIVAQLKIPSLETDRLAAKEEDAYLKRVPWVRRLRAIWKIHGAEYIFMIVVLSLQIGLGVWQCIKFSTSERYQSAFGWGVALAKACAGALYPTIFFMLLSMSRWASAWMRRSRYLCRVVNWDVSQSFHIKMAITTLILGTLHAIGHMAGTFVYGSMPDRQAAVAAAIGAERVPMTYTSYLRLTPGWTGLATLGLFYVMAFMGMSSVRKRSYEIFQLSHLLMYPIMGLLIAHGTLALLEAPALGYVMIIPSVLIFFERVVRTLQGLQRIPATLEILDDETIVVTIEMPKLRFWRYDAGQYVFLQVPRISFLQWHPFTITSCIGRILTLHIKTDGDWTSQLRKIGESLDFVGIDGPFGAPAQRFYEFDQSIIVGAGIGITPFAGILSDIQNRERAHWKNTRRRPLRAASPGSNRDSKSRPSSVNALPGSSKRNGSTTFFAGRTSMTVDADATFPTDIDTWQTYDLDTYRRVDFHWIVRDQSHLRWFSSLLNRISSAHQDSNLDIRLDYHLTTKRKDLPTHVFHALLEQHRTSEQPTSPLTGLIAPTHFGRPNFEAILNSHYEEMMELFQRDPKRKRRVGVFFCGAPILGRILVDLCHQMTRRGREDGSFIEYHSLVEVFY
jgi:predicted ferric reductase